MRRKSFILLGVVVLYCAGCASDEREPIIQSMVRQVDIASTKVKGIRSKVEEAVNLAEKKAKKENRAPKAADLTETELKGAEDAVKGLKEIGAKYMEEYQKAQRIKEPLTTEQQEIYAKLFSRKVQDEMSVLEREDGKLHDAIAAAEKINPDSTKKLNEKLQEAFGDFESITKRN